MAFSQGLRPLRQPSLDQLAPALSLGEPPFLIGFSGGGDSLALLRECIRRGPVHALIVDHALREDSGEIARAAAEMARQHGATPEIVRLQWASPPSGQAHWRKARLTALCEAARRLGVQEIMLGHTMDDQAETVAMRLAAGSGWRGLAGMSSSAPAPIWPQGRGLRVVRPLLAVSRADLRTDLQAAGTPWLEDRANSDARFARVRARTLLARSPELRASFLGIAALAAKAANAIDTAAQGALSQGIVFEGGAIRFPLEPGLGGSYLAQLRLLACLLCAASGRERVCTDAVAARALQRLMAGESFTVAGARLRRCGGEAVLERDPGAVLGRGRGPQALSAVLVPNMAQVWDNRLECRAGAAGWRIAPGSRGHPRMFHADHAPRGMETGESGAPYARWLLFDRVNDLLWRAGK